MPVAPGRYRPVSVGPLIVKLWAGTTTELHAEAVTIDAGGRTSTRMATYDARIAVGTAEDVTCLGPVA